MCTFEIKYRSEASDELDALRPYDRVRVLDTIEKELRHAPAAARGNKKRLDLGHGDFIHQLRIGDYRVFYDVQERDRLVIVRHVRLKGRRTTGDIL